METDSSRPDRCQFSVTAGNDSLGLVPLVAFVDNILITRLSIQEHVSAICMLKCVKNWKKYSDQTYSCPRESRLSASWGPLDHHSIKGFKGNTAKFPYKSSFMGTHFGHLVEMFDVY